MLLGAGEEEYCSWFLQGAVQMREGSVVVVGVVVCVVVVCAGSLGYVYLGMDNQPGRLSKKWIGRRRWVASGGERPQSG